VKTIFSSGVVIIFIYKLIDNYMFVFFGCFLKQD